MKRNKISRVATAVAIASFAGLMTACGSSGSSSSAVGLPGIGVGQGVLSGSGGCVALSQTMSFSATGAYYDGYANLYMGPQLAGQSYIAAGGATTGGQMINTVLPPQDGGQQRITSWIGYMGINITSGVGMPGYSGYSGYSGGYGSSGTSLTGSFAFSAAAWQYLSSLFSYGYGVSGSYGIGLNTPISGTGYNVPSPYGTGSYGSTTVPNTCVSSISINTGVYPWNTGSGQATLYSGELYLTINGEPTQFPI